MRVYRKVYEKRVSVTLAPAANPTDSELQAIVHKHERQQDFEHDLARSREYRTRYPLRDCGSKGTSSMPARHR